MKYEYEGPVEIHHYMDDWGSFYCGTEDIGTLVVEALGKTEEEYEYAETKLHRVRVTVEVLEVDPPLPPQPPKDSIADFEAPIAPEVPPSTS